MQFSHEWLPVVCHAVCFQSKPGSTNFGGGAAMIRGSLTQNGGRMSFDACTAIATGGLPAALKQADLMALRL